MYKILPVFVIISVFLSACTSSKELMESGHYDSAFRRSLDAVLESKKPEKRDEQLKILEAAYAQAMSKDRMRVEQLKESGNEAYWPQISDIYAQMERRQNMVSRHIPLQYSNGTVAKIELWNLSAVKDEALERSAGYYYNLAMPLITSTRKLDVRQGFDYLERAATYKRDYKDLQEYLPLAAEKGTNYILIYANVDRFFPLFVSPTFVEDLLPQIHTNSVWLQFDKEIRDGRRYSYVMNVLLTTIDKTPGSVRDRAYDEYAEIEDGWQYVYDSRGNVMKDSLGNDIKVPKVVRVHARVVETIQSKALRLNAEVQISDPHRDELIESIPIYGEALFSNVAYTYTGDPRALSKDTKSRLGNVPLPFPTDDEMLFIARDKLRESLQRLIYDNESFLLQ